MTAPLPHWLVNIVALAVLPAAARGHVLDEYLQSTLVAIEPDGIRLKINLTPGVEIADQVLSKIDRDGDGAVSVEESAAYAAELKRDLTIRLDGRDTQLQLIASTVPELAELRTGHGIIQLEFSLAPSSLTGGSHRLTFENRHFESIGVYLFNAARPQSASIRIVSQSRNRNQSQGEIDFSYSAPNSFSLRAAGVFTSVVFVLVGMLAALWRIRWHPQNL